TATAGIAAVAPAAASAVTTGSVSGNTLTITSGPEDNTIQFNGGGNTGGLYLTDTAGISAGAGCTADPNNPTQGMTCGDTGTTVIVANLGDGANQITDDGYFLWHHP